MRLIHYGDLNGGNILPAEVYQDSCTYGHKPEGKNLLWTSPKESDESWAWWCESEMPERLEGKTTELELSESARIARVNSYSDLEALGAIYPDTRSSSFKNLDWYSLSQDYDAFWLTVEGQWDTRLTHPLSLYGFDCETVLIFNTALVKVIGVSEEVVVPA